MHTRVPWNKLNSSQLLFSWTPPNVYLWNNYLSQSQTTWGARAYDIFQDKAFFHFSGLQRKREPQFFRDGLTSCRTFPGIVKSAEPCKCVILLVSRILWHERINPSLKEWGFWYSPATFRHNLSFPVYAVPLQWRLLIYIGKNLLRRVLEANKKHVPLKSYSLEIRIVSVNQILKIKEKVK